MSVRTSLLEAVARRRAAERPYRHWLLERVLPEAACAAIADLPFAPPPGDYPEGKREVHNAARAFFGPGAQRRFAVCREVAEGFQDPRVVAALEAACGRALAGGYLRIEYCQDLDGFWLEPHTDISAKLLTLQLYLTTGPGAEALGTDVYDAAGNLAKTVPAVHNTAFMFAPAGDTWHGFRRRPIAGVRRTLIVNYVASDWRSRHELAFPERPAGA